MKTNPIRVFAVDDHPLMMAGIAASINSHIDLQMVGEATDGDSALRTYREVRPDVTLMDLRMPRMNGIDVIVSIRAEFPAARIIVLTTNAGDIQILRALKAGAMAYLLKSTLRTDLVDTIRRVHAGQRIVPAELAATLTEHLGDTQITPRELSVLRGIATGASNRAIGAVLHITEHTVKGHLKNILMKLDAHDRTQAVIIAVKRGFLEL